MSRPPRPVTSTKNPAVQRFRDAATGRSDGLMMAEGMRLCGDALAAGLEVVEAAVSPRLEDGALRDRLLAAAASVLECNDALLQRISGLETPPGVAVVLRRPRTALSDLLRGGRAPLIVVAAGLRDPGNLGAVLRTAEAAGATGCITTGGGADPFREKAVRGSMGSVFRLPVVHGPDAASVVAFARGNGLALVVADGDGEVDYTAVDWRRPSLLVVGAEAAGVADEWLAAADQRVAIPLQAPVESLNVAVAAGVVLYEARRQRHGGA